MIIIKQTNIGKKVYHNIKIIIKMMKINNQISKNHKNIYNKLNRLTMFYLIKKRSQKLNKK